MPVLTVNQINVVDKTVTAPLPPAAPVSVLDEAVRIVHGPRRKEYGHPLDNHTLTADYYNGYLRKRYPGIQITAEDVCILNLLQKVSRMATTNTITRDGLVDICGYAANVELVQDERERRTAKGHL
jgi:hypothetical protein